MRVIDSYTVIYQRLVLIVRPIPRDIQMYMYIEEVNLSTHKCMNYTPLYIGLAVQLDTMGYAVQVTESYIVIYLHVHIFQ